MTKNRPVDDVNSPAKGLASLAGGWEGSEELARRILEIRESSRREFAAGRLSTMDPSQILETVFSEDEDLDPEVARVWAEEAKRRARAMTTGQEKGIPADEVFEKLRKGLR